MSIEDGTIRAVGRFVDVQRQAFGSPLDLGDAVLLPGLVNCHCHLELTDMAGRVPHDGTFTEWLKKIVAAKREWQQTEYEHSALHGVQMLLQSGTTSVCDVVSWWP